MTKFSYGFELELSDIDRRVDIPTHLGEWEGEKVNGYYQSAELDIVNTVPPYIGVAPDPLNEFCTVGGEINVSPTTSIEGQLARVVEIFNLFPIYNISHVNHFHIHVFIPNLREDLTLLKRFTKYVIKNQEHLVECTYLQDFYISENISNESRVYLKSDGGRYINPIIIDDIDKCNNTDELLELFKTPSVYKDNGKIVQHSSIRTAVNLSQLISGKTVEFRCFRASTNLKEIVSELILVKRFCEEALKENPKHIHEILSEELLTFAPLNYNHMLQLGWEKTKLAKSRGDHIKYSKTQFKEPNDISSLDIFKLWNDAKNYNITHTNMKAYYESN